MSEGVVRGANDPDYVRGQYAHELGLRARKSVYRDVAGVDARDVAFAAVADALRAVAAWMLYHVPDLDRGVAELARVLRPGGRLVAVTNYEDHLHEMFGLVGISRWELPFGGENGAQLLARHFERVEHRDADGTVTFHDADSVRGYLSSSERLAGYADNVPELAEPVVARRRPVVFVADK